MILSTLLSFLISSRRCSFWNVAVEIGRVFNLDYKLVFNFGCCFEHLFILNFFSDLCVDCFNLISLLEHFHLLAVYV